MFLLRIEKSVSYRLTPQKYFREDVPGLVEGLGDVSLSWAALFET